MMKIKLYKNGGLNNNLSFGWATGMAKKRKSIATSLHELDRTIYSSFSSAANSKRVDQELQLLIYSATFRCWATLNELDYCGEEPCMSPRAPQHQQQSQPVMQVTGSGFPVTSGFSGQTIVGQGLRSEHCDKQSKNYVFSNASSNPVRQIGEGGYHPSGLSMGNVNRSIEPNLLHQQSRDSAAFSSNDSAMDMHAD
ncbi:hypothetical protein JHK86_056490 [Glycine max]|nr:hypothetical protein JHK86_056490 [Glycine max]